MKKLNPLEPSTGHGLQVSGERFSVDVATDEVEPGCWPILVGRGLEAFGEVLCWCQQNARGEKSEKKH